MEALRLLVYVRYLPSTRDVKNWNRLIAAFVVIFMNFVMVRHETLGLISAHRNYIYVI